MVRFSFLAIALGLQPVAGQFCGIQASCSSCVSTVGCVWNINVCLSSTTIPLCSPDTNCMSSIGQCSVFTSPIVYPPVSTVSPPLYTGTVLPPVVAGASIAAPPLYATTSVGSPVISPPLFSSVLPSVLPAPILPAAPIYTSPAPVYGGFYGGGGFYGNGGFDNDNTGFFDLNGNPVGNTIRNNFYANALSPIVPGIGGAVGFANNINLVRNAPDFVNNLVGDQGYRRNPVGSFVRNGFYANALGGILPGLGGPLNQFNKLDLAATLLG